jgi:2-amino-4-hydroxy-6-hydroxymethyldihydropteridine diphosphokinase
MAIIALGSNVDPEVNLPLAVEALSALGDVRGVSTAYENSAVGPPGQPDFVNAAVWLETDQAPDDLRRQLHAIERRLRRRPSDDRYAPRTADLDLCLWDQRVDPQSDHPLPDPDLLSRAYLAVVVAELVPNLEHPVTGETMRAIAARLAPGAVLRARPELTIALRKAGGGGAT